MHAGMYIYHTYIRSVHTYIDIQHTYMYITKTKGQLVSPKGQMQPIGHLCRYYMYVYVHAWMYMSLLFPCTYYPASSP